MLRLLRKLTGSILLITGMLLIIYNVYWLYTHSASAAGGFAGGLGEGFALLLTGVGILLAIAGFLIRR